MTVPAGAVLLFWLEMLPTTRPAFTMAVWAAACSNPTTLGTLVWVGPNEITRFTADPAATIVPPAGFWLITLPTGTVVLFDEVTVPTISPAPVIWVVAAA